MKRSLAPSFSLLLVTLLVMFLTASNFNNDVHQKTVSKVDNFTLNDYNGNSHSLTDYKSYKFIVLMFISTQCPVSNAYNEKMNKLFEDYHPENIAFIGLNSNKSESIENIKEHAKAHSFQFPILKDWDNVIADRLNAQVTPEIFVLNKEFDILYHGRIDDARGAGSAKNSDLISALNNLLEGKEVTIKQTRAVGCTIKRVGS